MTTAPADLGTPLGGAGPWRRADTWVVVGLVLVSAWLRLRGLGTWPLAVDEYYLWQSVSFILERGLPSFPDAGFYQRGLLLQYLSALPMALLDRSELAIRLVPAASGIVAAPVVYGLARRSVERPWAIVAALVIAVSSLHVEMSRFARFYAPFALLYTGFAWCALAALDGSTRARRLLVALAIVAPLVHEGGIFVAIGIGLAILCADRPTARPALLSIGAAAVLAVWNYLWNGVNLRFLGTTRDPGEGLEGGARARFPVILPEFPLISAAFASPLTIAAWLVFATVSSWTAWRAIRRAPLAFWPATVIAGATLLIALQQIGAAAVVIVVGCLARADVARAVRLSWLAALAGFVGFWSVLAYATDVTSRRFRGVWVERVLDYADVLDSLVLPFVRAIPALAAVLACLVVVACVFVWRSGTRSTDLARLTTLFVASFALVPLFRTPVNSTRYAFFLWPVGVVVAVCGASLLSRTVTRDRRASWVAAVAAAVAFGFSGDFHAERFLRPATPELNFRTGPYARYTDHWYQRTDYRTPAVEVARRAAPGDVVFTDAVTAAPYLERDFSVFVPTRTSRYPTVAIDGGAREIWSSRPLVNDPAQIAAAVRASGRGWLLAESKPGGFRAFEQDPTDLFGAFEIDVTPHTGGVDGRFRLYRLEPRSEKGPQGPGRPRATSMICGPGDPEGFFFLDAAADPSGAGEPQERIIERLEGSGANGLYVIAVRSHGGDGDSAQNPFEDPADPTSPLDDEKLARWRGWLERLDDAGVTTFLFLYDDAADPFGGRSELSSAERAWIVDLVEALAGIERLVWVVAEEYQEAIPTPRAAAIGRLLREVDPDGRLVGAHQLPGLSFDFADDDTFDVFMLQWGEAASTPRDLHDAVVEAKRRARGRYDVLMSEVPWDGVGDDDGARRKVWAMAMAGAGVLVNGWEVLDTPFERLRECGVLLDWFGGLRPIDLEPADALARGDTDYVLRARGGARLAYAADGDDALGLADLPVGTWRVEWVDPASGERIRRDHVQSIRGGVSFPRPDGFEGEAALRLDAETR